MINAKFLDGIQSNNREAMKIVAQLMILAVKNQLQKSKSISMDDLKSKEIDKAIGNGIYQALFSMVNFDAEKECKQHIDGLMKAHSGKLEEPQLNKVFKAIIDKWANTPVVFKSDFLNDQFALKNIKRHKDTAHIAIVGSSEFKGVDSEKRKSHLQKITGLLKKEGYRFYEGLYLKA